MNLHWLRLAIGVLLTEAVVVGNFLFAPKLLGIPHEDLLYHAGGFMVPMAWWFIVFTDKKSRRYFIGACLAAALGFEVLQQLSRYHVFDWLDVMANATGGLMGALLASRYGRKEEPA